MSEDHGVHTRSPLDWPTVRTFARGQWRGLWKRAAGQKSPSSGVARAHPTRSRTTLIALKKVMPRPSSSIGSLMIKPSVTSSSPRRVRTKHKQRLATCWLLRPLRKVQPLSIGLTERAHHVHHTEACRARVHKRQQIRGNAKKVPNATTEGQTRTETKEPKRTTELSTHDSTRDATHAPVGSSTEPAPRAL